MSIFAGLPGLASESSKQVAFLLQYDRRTLWQKEFEI